MELRSLGNSGLAVSPLGLGTVKLGRNTALKYPHAFELPDDAQVRSLLELAQRLGINLIDTAPAYGASEERLGHALAGERDRWVLSTKVGEQFDPDTGLSRFDFSPGHVRSSVERSLRRLRTDHLDIVLVHSDGRERDESGALGALEILRELKREGKSRAVGFSAKTLEGAALAMSRSDVLMLALNPQDREMLPAVRAAAEHGVGVLIKKGLRSGHLDGSGGLPDPVEASLGFLLSQPGVASVVIGTINAEHLRQNAAAVERVLGLGRHR